MLFWWSSLRLVTPGFLEQDFSQVFNLLSQGTATLLLEEGFMLIPFWLQRCLGAARVQSTTMPPRTVWEASTAEPYCVSDTDLHRNPSSLAVLLINRIFRG